MRGPLLSVVAIFIVAFIITLSSWELDSSVASMWSCSRYFSLDSSLEGAAEPVSGISYEQNCTRDTEVQAIKECREMELKYAAEVQKLANVTLEYRELQEKIQKLEALSASLNKPRKDKNEGRTVLQNEVELKSYLEGLGEDMGRYYSVPKNMRDRAVAYRGDLIRMKQFLQKVVVERKRFRVVAVGTSITAEFAGYRGDQGVLANRWNREQPWSRAKDGWLTNALDWLSETFPAMNEEKEEERQMPSTREGNVTGPEAAPKAGYYLRNNGWCGAEPGLFLSCYGRALMEDMPRDIDLLVIEFSVTMRTAESCVILDKVLQMFYRHFSPAPAILFVNFFEFCPHDPYCVNDARRAVGDLFPPDKRSWSSMYGIFSDIQADVSGKVHPAADEKITALARYYGLPVISVRDAMFHALANQVEGLGLEDIVKDGVHPSPLGRNKTVPDLLISFFQDVIRDMLRPTPPRTELEQAMEKCYLSIPPPLMFDPDSPKDNTEIVEKDCYIFDNLIDGHLPRKITLSGWNWTLDSDTKKYKPGLIARGNGSMVEMELDTTTSSARMHFSSEKARLGAQAIVEVSYLQSYERMGDILFECASNCQCAPRVLNGTSDARVSIPKTESIDVTQAPNCQLRLTCIEGIKGHKCKLTMLQMRFLAQLS